MTQWIVVIFFLCIKGFVACRNNMCFTWQVSPEYLTMTCRLENLIHRVFIVDPHGETHASCIPSNNGIACYLYNDLGGITYQNVNTNEIIYTVNGTADERLNGNWTCLHGTHFDAASVQVTILRINDSQASSCPSLIRSDEWCLRHSIILGVMGYTSSVLFMICAMIFCQRKVIKFNGCLNNRFRKNIKIFKNKVTRYYVKLAFFLIMTDLFFLLPLALPRGKGDTCRFMVVWPLVAPICGIFSSALLAYPDQFKRKKNENKDTDFEIGTPLNT